MVQAVTVPRPLIAEGTQIDVTTRKRQRLEVLKAKLVGKEEEIKESDERYRKAEKRLKNPVNERVLESITKEVANLSATHDTLVKERGGTMLKA